MKSRLIKAQNQRVERISAATLVVGINIAKEKHAAQAINFRGVVLTNRPISFQMVEMVLNIWNGAFGSCRRCTAWVGDVIVGMESTGHYWFNIAHWLVQQGIDVVLVNPMTTKRNKENRDNSPSKSDPKDALIADRVWPLQ